MQLANPIHIAAIDAGSNAIRLAISAATGPDDINSLVKERVPVRLGHHTFTRGELDPETLDNAVVAFARFRKLFDQYGVQHYRAVSTSAVRSAKNRDTLLHRLYHDTGIELEVIDGEEEARLVRRAVRGSFSRGPKPESIVDLGGGSLEITNKIGKRWQTASMRIGTVRLMEAFGLTGAITPDEAKMMRRYVASLLQTSLSLDEVPANCLTAACGGNAEELARLFGERDSESGKFVLTAEQLNEALPKLLKYDVEKRMSKFGVRRDRAEVMGVASLVFATVMSELQIEHMVVPEVGIREGVLLELAESNTGGTPSTGVSRELALVASARTFAARIGHNTTHGEQVRRLSRAMFDQLTDVHGMPRERAAVLEVAALLHDIGEVVHRKGHHKHGEYLVLNGRIPGLQSPEREMVAALVRAHRKSLPTPKRHLTYGQLSPEHQSDVRKLNALLRVADAIDTDHRQRVLEVRAETLPDRVRLHIVLVDDVGETTHMAERKAEAFKQEMGIGLEFDSSVVPSTHRYSTSRTE